MVISNSKLLIAFRISSFQKFVYFPPISLIILGTGVVVYYVQTSAIRLFGSVMDFRMHFSKLACFK